MEIDADGMRKRFEVAREYDALVDTRCFLPYILLGRNNASCNDIPCDACMSEALDALERLVDCTTPVPSSRQAARELARLYAGEAAE